MAFFRKHNGFSNLSLHVFFFRACVVIFREWHWHWPGFVIDCYERTAILRKVVGKMCTQQSRKVTWDMINTLFLTLQPSNLLLLLSFRIRKHTSMASRAILSNFFEEHRTQNNQHCFSGLLRALSLTTFLEIAVYCLLEMLLSQDDLHHHEWVKWGTNFETAANVVALRWSMSLWVS